MPVRIKLRQQVAESVALHHGVLEIAQGNVHLRRIVEQLVTGCLLSLDHGNRFAGSGLDAP
jgi:hypothetical protein